MSRRGILASGLLAGVVVPFFGGVAAADHDGITTRFAIPAQPLEQALQDFARQSGEQLLYSPGLATSKRSSDLHGIFQTDEALRRLLSGTSIRWSKSPRGGTYLLTEAYNQPAPPDPPLRGSSQQPIPVVPQAAANNTSQAAASPELGAIIVTARRRAENVQRVPVAITVVTNDLLRERNVRNEADLQSIVPSLSVNGGSVVPIAPIINIRGQGRLTPGAPASVLTYFNEVPSQTAGGTSGGGSSLTGSRFYDLSDIQVLKGPQGTLFGRNTIGGALLYTSRRPTDEAGGYIEAGIGNYAEHAIDGALNVPLVEDKVLLRVAGERVVRDGFVTTLSAPGHPTPYDQANTDIWGLRGTLTVKPTDGLRNDLIIEASSNKARGIPFFLAAVNPASPLAAVLDPFLQQQQALGIRRHIPISVDELQDLKNSSVTDIAEIDLSDSVKIRNIAAYLHYKLYNLRDLDGTALGILDNPQQTIRPLVSDQISEEFQVQGRSGGLNWVGGLFFLRDKSPHPASNLIVNFDSPLITTTTNSTHSYAAYAQTDYDLASLLEGLKLTAGFRYTWDTSSFARLDIDQHSTNKSSAPTWTVSLNYQANRTTLLYIASRRGYRSGGYNTVSNGLIPFGPEYVTDVETGVKADWSIAGIKARTNIAGYYQWFTDIQLGRSILVNGFLASLTQNAGKADLYGTELETQFQLARNLNLTGNFSYFHQRFTELDSGVNPGVAIYDPRKVPRYTYSIGADYTLPLPEAVGNISLLANWNWISWVSTNSDYVPNEPFSRIPSYGLLTLGVNWQGIMGRPIDASFYMNNALNKVYLASANSLYASAGFAFVNYGAPRTFGVRLRYHFGGER